MKKIYLTIITLSLVYNAFAQKKFPSTGIAIYNTTDTITNYERVRSAWGSNIFTANSESAGTGTVTRAMSFVVNAGIFSINNAATSGVISVFDFNRTGGHGSVSKLLLFYKTLIIKPKF